MPTNFILREWQLTDKSSLAGNANNINVWNNVRDYFPNPYTEADVEQFIGNTLLKPKPATDFAIVVGGIGVVPQTDVERIAIEIGYWLGSRKLLYRKKYRL